MSDFFLKALIVHLVADWFLQSDWMSVNKTSLRYPAAWVHSGIHTLGYLLIMPVGLALAIGITHILIDTRKPLIWLRRIFRQNPKGAVAPVFEIWQDQATHIVILAAAALVIG